MSFRPISHHSCPSSHQLRSSHGSPTFPETTALLSMPCAPHGAKESIARAASVTLQSPRMGMPEGSQRTRFCAMTPCVPQPHACPPAHECPTVPWCPMVLHFSSVGFGILGSSAPVSPVVSWPWLGRTPSLGPGPSSLREGPQEMSSVSHKIFETSQSLSI